MSLPREPLQWILAALVFTSVSRIQGYSSFVAALHPGKLLFGAAVLYVLTNPSSLRTRNLWSTWPPKLVAALGILACLSIPFALSIGHAGSFFLQNFAKTLAIFFFLVMAIRDWRDLYLYVWAYVLACAFLIYISVFVIGLEAAGDMQRLATVGIGFDANDLGLVLTTGLPLAMATYENSGKVGRWTSLVVLLGIGASLARSGSRGGLLGLIAVAVALLFLLRRVSLVKRIGIVVAVGGTLAVVSPQGYWEQMETLTEPTDDYNWQSPYGRKAIAERGLGYMLGHPLVGVGVGNFGRAEGTLSDISRRRQQSGQGYMWTAPHNSYIQVGAELGIPGMVIFCWLIFGGILGLVRLRNRSPPRSERQGRGARFVHDLTVYLPVAIVGYAVTTFFLSFAYINVTYILIAFVAGVYLCADHRAGTVARVDRRRYRVRAGSGADRAPLSR